MLLIAFTAQIFSEHKFYFVKFENLFSQKLILFKKKFECIS